MATKTEYREYIAGEHWQKRRKEFLDAFPNCNECDLPRWLAIIAYDQDLHVHHKSYARIGKEVDDDLEALCRRCHEVRTFGSSTLHEVSSIGCKLCGDQTYDSASRMCHNCKLVIGGSDDDGLIPPVLQRDFGGAPMWDHLLWDIALATIPYGQVDVLIGRLAQMEKQIGCPANAKEFRQA